MTGKVAAFAKFGVTLKNARQSWSGLTPDGDVVLGLWLDEFKNGLDPAEYHPNAQKIEIWHDRPGNRERIGHLRHARDNRNGRLLVVVLVAVDTSADTREVAEAYARKGLTMRLTEFDEDSGFFRAVVDVPRQNDHI